MSDIQHEKFAQLMSEVEELEGQIAALKKEGTEPSRLAELQEKLIEGRNRLTQLSDGCGHGHNPGV